MRITTDDVSRAVRELYLATGTASTVDEIASYLTCSAATVRKRISECDGCPPGTASDEERRASYSKSYRWQESGHHKVTVYLPRLSALRDLINGLRAALPATDTTVAA